MLMRIAILIHGFLFIDIWLLISCDTGIYAIIFINNALLHPVVQFQLQWGKLQAIHFSIELSTISKHIVSAILVRISG